jgi:hypothetical protein
LVARLVDEAREEFPDLSVEEVDVAERPDVAVKYGVMATPALAINGRLEFTGIPREDALRARLQSAAGGREGGPA